MAGGGTHAFIAGMNGTGMNDLNSLVSLSNGNFLTAAHGIKDRGQIIPEDYNGGHADLLTPSRAPSSLSGAFYGDGKADILWTNTATPERAMWLMNGTAVTGGGILGSVPLAWSVSH